MSETTTHHAQSYRRGDTSRPVIDQTVGGLLRWAAGEAPDDIALVAGTVDPSRRRRWTYAELLEDSERVAQVLLIDLEPGDRVAVWAQNVPEWVIVEYAAALAGLELVAVNPALTAAEVEYIIRHSNATSLLHGSTFRGVDLGAIASDLRGRLPALRGVKALTELVGQPAPSETKPLPEVAPTDVAHIQYTSGTTGKPKGVVLQHRAVTNVARFCVGESGFPQGGALLSPMPMFHTAGCVVCTLGPAWYLGSQVLLEEFRPELALELIEHERAVAMGSVPTMLTAMLDHPTRQDRDLSSVEVFLCGATTVPAPLVRRIEREVGCSVIVLFGQTELASTVCQTLPSDSPEDKAQTIGVPLPNAELKVIDPATGETVPPGVAGELCARGYQTMLGYFDDPEQTAKTLDAEGWVHTGDLCVMEDRGYFSVAGRLKDIIIRGGENIAPKEIEECLLGCQGVADVAVVGVPDERLGERVAAVICPGDPVPSVGMLRDHAARELAKHKIPADWYIVDGLPMTASGKVQKFVLRDLIADGGLERIS